MSDDLYDGIVRILKARPGEAMRVIVVDVGCCGEQRAVAVTKPSDRVFAPTWSVQGHGVIAKVALDDILMKDDPTAYKKIKLLIQDDPLGRNSIEKMAQWPDRIKPPARDDEFKPWQSLGQAHRKDHYVNYELDLDDTSVSEPIGEGNLLPALEQWSNIFVNQTDAEERGHALAFLTHLIGDIHMPLHCSALTGEYFPVSEFPDGDQGGNLIWWGETRTLHSLWDGLILPKADGFPDAVEKLREGLDRDAFANRLQQSSTFEGWARESYGIARKVYKTFFDLTPYIKKAKREKDEDTVITGQLFEQPGDEFRAFSKELAFEQGRVAAFRLADHLRHLLT